MAPCCEHLGHVHGKWWFPRCSSWRVWWRSGRHSVGVIWCHTGESETSLAPPFNFLQFSLSLSYWLDYVDILNWRASPPEAAWCLCWHRALQLTEGCPECTGHNKAQGTTKPLLDTYGLVKPQTVMKDRQGKMRQPPENYWRTCTGIKLQVHVPGWNFSYELAGKVFQAELLVDSVLFLLWWLSTGNQALWHDCTPYAMQNLLMSKYHHTDTPPSFVSLSFKICPDTQKLFWARKGFTVINRAGTAIPVSGALI